MRFYYTNAQQYLAQQKNPARSLGGFLSASVVPNNALENLFGEISIRGRQRGGVEYRCLALKNETPALISGARLYLTQPVAAGVQGDLNVAVTLPGVDNCGRVQYELIENGRTEPYYADFTRPDPATAILLPDLAPGATLAVWVRRIVKPFIEPDLPLDFKAVVLPGPLPTAHPTDTPQPAAPAAPVAPPVPPLPAPPVIPATPEPLPIVPALGYEDMERELPIICVEWV